MSNTIKAIGLLGILIVLCSCESAMFSPSNDSLRPPPKADTSSIAAYNKTDKIPGYGIVPSEIKSDEVTNLITLMEETDSPSFCAEVARDLGKMKDSRAVEPLIKALSSRFGQYSNASGRIIWALGEIGDVRAVEPLSKILRGSGSDANSSAYALGKIGGNEAVRILREDLLKYPRRSTGAALKELNWTPRTQQGKIAYFIATENSEQLVKLGQPAVKALIDDLDKSTFAASVLGDIGDPRAIQPLVKLLNSWKRGPEISSALIKLGWKPTTTEEKIRILLCNKNKEMLLKNWDAVKRFLLAEARNGDHKQTRQAVYDLMKLGQPDTINEMCAILKSKGTKQMAEMFLNSGQEELESAARDWFERKGYQIVTYPTSQKPDGWGGM